MNSIQCYDANVNFKSVKTRVLNDSVAEKMVNDFNKKILDIKFSGNFAEDVRKYTDMQAECNKILLDILEATKRRTVSYECAKKQVERLNII